MSSTAYYPRRRQYPVTVEEALERMGYWFPPDAIAAVREGRETYHPIDSSVTYELGERRGIILRAMAMLQR